MPLLPLLGFCLLWLSLPTLVLASDASPSSRPAAIWSGLILATNNPHPAEAPVRLHRYAEKLKNIFGYNQFELIGEYSEKLGDTNERWLIPSNLSVRTQIEPGQRNRGYPMKIALFQNRHRLAEFETHLSPESPLFIRGPLYAGGQLVIVLHVVDPSEPSGHARTPLVTPSPAQSPMQSAPRSEPIPSPPINSAPTPAASTQSS